MDVIAVPAHPAPTSFSGNARTLFFEFQSIHLSAVLDAYARLNAACSHAFSKYLFFQHDNRPCQRYVGAYFFAPNKAFTKNQTNN